MEDTTSQNYGPAVSLSINDFVNNMFDITYLKEIKVSSYNERSLYPRNIGGRADKLERANYYLSIFPLHNLMNRFKMASIKLYYLSIFLYFSERLPTSLYYFTSLKV